MIEVDSIIIHPEYSAPSCYHDIALVKLVAPPIFTKDMRPACLPTLRTISQTPGAVTVATGWGKLGFGKESSLHLMKVSLKIVNNLQCYEFYKGNKKKQILEQGIVPSMLCASGYEKKIHDTCQGDSGGPLQSMKKGSKCMMEVIGITSFGKSCGIGIPAVYTRVSSYLDWIESIVWP